MLLTLVTGAPGWLGTRLARVLLGGLPEAPGLERADPGRRIRCLVLPGSDTAALRGLGGIEVVEGSLGDEGALAQFCAGGEEATLFHCAGVVHPRRAVRELFDVNVEGTRRLLGAVARAGVRRVVAVSSNSPIGVARRPDDVFDEDSAYRPYLGYGRSKLLMERCVQEYQRQGALETVIIRPPWFYGPDQPPRQTLFFRMIREGKAPILGDGQQRRSMVYLDNLCQGLLLAERTPRANGQTYWIADRRPYTMNEIVDTVERLLEGEFGLMVAHRRLRLPSVVADAAEAADRLIQRAGFYQQKVHVLGELNKTIACSIGKAERELGYQPAVELEEGMRRSIRWCLENGIAI
jgi:nucleoside-diphosphate-sugar epimerase